MIRDHLLRWRRTVQFANYAEYIRRVQELPEDDRETAAALWGGSEDERPAILMAFHHLGEYRHAIAEQERETGQRNLAMAQAILRAK